MSKHVHLAWFGLTLMIFGAALRAQTTNTFPSSGNVGIGTTNPTNKLHIAGEAYASGGYRVVAGDIGDDVNGAPWYGLGDVGSLLPGSAGAGDSVQLAGYGGLNFQTGSGQMALTRAGSFGVGTMSPQTIMQLGTMGNNTNKLSIPGALNFENIFLGHNNTDGGDALEFVNHGDVNGSYGVKFLADTDTGGINALQIQVAPYTTTYASLAYKTALTILANNGAVGIGTTGPGYKLDVAGQIHTSGSIVFADNTTQSTAWTGSLCGGDYAESVDVTGDRTKYEPGDVLVIDPDVSGKFLKSAEPYSTAVTGIYSTKPGAVGRRQATPKTPDEVPMAMIGIVPTKVSAENGPIHRGDLLVTSSIMGYAMKGTDRSRLTGAVIGKALDNLESGKGIIEVVVTLQ